MERGNAKNSSKSNNPDIKSKQDVANKHLRLPSSKDTLSPRQDSRKKANPQKNRELFDKRPQNKSAALCKKYRSEVTDECLYDPFNRGTKKTNLNHLLNFTLASHNSWEPHHKRSLKKLKHPKYNKELFLQANCQFVANENGNYEIYQRNPDMLLEWSLIEEIRLPCHEVPVCPICLYSPVAAKITRCGHVYCWTCMLHYLALTDKTWQKCPICFESVHKTDLKSVSLQTRKFFAVGDEITMFLMKREKTSLSPTPVCRLDVASHSMHNVDEKDLVTRYQKLLLASTKEISVIIGRERKELQEAFIHEKDAPEACFIESALKLLDEREGTVFQAPTDAINTEKYDVKNDNIVERKHLNSVGSTDANDSKDNGASVDSATHYEQNLCCKDDGLQIDNKKGISFFYQAEDGQHIYLHSLNVRMLLSEYQSLEFAPQNITAKIVEIEAVSMTEVLRKRLRYLQHLPLTCEFQIVELDFSNHLPHSSISVFEEEIKKRKQNRFRKARDERRREKVIQVEENKKLGKYPGATYNLNNADQFPAYNPDDFLSLSPPKYEIFADSKHQGYDANLNNVSPEANAFAVSTQQSPPTTSFAQILKVGQKEFVKTPQERKAVVDAAVLQTLEADPDEDCTAAPEYRQSFSDAIQDALNAVSISNSADKNAKRKKKGKKQLLFTTSMCRNK